MTRENPGQTAAPMPAAVPTDNGGNAAYRVTLPEFEGPLDLLLHLCQTHELDILNISIAFVAEKYIEYLELMQNMSVEVAADYLVMAAHLAYLKSRELVPTPEPVEATEEGEEPIDPREELIRRLLEYQKYKHAAEGLGNRPIEGRNVFVRGVQLEAGGEAGLAEHSVWKLLEHWAGILEKAKPKYTHDVVVDRISISDRINQIVDMIEAGKGMVRFEELLGEDLPEAELRHKVVVSLLAVLELARLRVVRILHQEATGSFFLAQVEGAPIVDARTLTVTSAKEGGPSEPTSESEAEATETQAATVPTESEAEATLPTETEPQAATVPTEGEAETTVPTETEAQTTTVPTEGDEAANETSSVHEGEGDSGRLLAQEEVISASFPARVESGEEVTDGETQEEQKETTE
jgi:segregation and condensation protein A